MSCSTLPRNRRILGAILLGLAGLVVALWALRPKDRKQPTEILELIERLSEPAFQGGSTSQGGSASTQSFWR